MPRPRLEVADIITKHGKGFLKDRSLTRKQKAVLSAIKLCRTEKLGYHLDQCTECSHKEISYNSCRDRHCPKCQGAAQRQWVEKRTGQLLPVPYYHVVFTLPPGLFPFSLYNKELIYNLLFDSAASTLKDFGKDPQWLGGTLGFFGILHTWGQTLWHHPHVHFIVVGGALKADGSWVSAKHKGSFLFPVNGVSKVFRGKFMKGLERALNKNEFIIPEDHNRSGHPWNQQHFLQSLTKRSWIVYCKSPFKKAEQVIRYIGRYTHRVALNNSRLVSLEDGQVTFTYRDYKDNKRTKTMPLSAYDFLQRFLWHVLPEKFHRIRHYGFLANGVAQACCNKIRKKLGESSESQNKLPEQNKPFCKKCSEGIMVMLKLISPSGYLVIPGNRYGLENST
ncbi:MAG: IS91 family transposase [Desulfobulbaceae bacterium]|nr:MAG: IS91 family transposase [Desulfobulbaceae bacterium]